VTPVTKVMAVMEAKGFTFALYHFHHGASSTRDPRDGGALEGVARAAARERGVT